MKICPNCKTNNFDMNTECEKCGYPLRLNFNETVVAHLSNTDGAKPVFTVTRKTTNLSNSQRVARAFMIVSCILSIFSFFCFVVFLNFVDNVLVIIFNSGINNAVYYGLISLSLLRVAFSIFIIGIYNHRIVNDKKVGIAFGVVTLIFVNRISGILIICDSSK